MNSPEQQLQTTVQSDGVFSIQGFEHAQRIAVMLSKSSLIPEEYRGKVENVMIAMEMSTRLNISPLMVMQNLYIVKGKPGWAGKFVIALINGSKRFKGELQFEQSGAKGSDDYGYTAWTLNRDGVRIDGVKVDWKMVKGEGWLDKPGSKWKTISEQMFRYRAASFFANVHCPDLTMGMQTAEEIIDISHTEDTSIGINELKALYEEKLPLLNKSEMDNAKRILEKEEVLSYKKLYKFLTDKIE